MNVRSIAIVGEFASGKTTLADYLVENHGYTRVSFAKRLKEVCAAVYNGGQPIEKNASYVVSRESTNDTIISGRQVLQEFGQSVKALDRDFWIRWLLADLEKEARTGSVRPGSYVTDDCRFDYEADILRQHGFLIVKVSTPLHVRQQRYEAIYGRPPTEEEMNHPSETSVRDIEADVEVRGCDPVELLGEYVLHYAREVQVA